MSGELIRPNWHVVLIHYPLALLTVGVLIEIFSFLWRRSTFRTAGRWMILLGALLALPAAMSGLYAFRNVVAPGPTEPRTAWYRLVEKSPWSPEQWSLMKHHVIYAGTGTAVVALSLLVWLSVADRTRRRAHWLLVLTTAIGLGCLSFAAWYSGEAIYAHGTAVERPAPDHPAAAAEDDNEGFSLEDAFPPLQTHIVLAGLTTAAALVALGLSLHWWGRARRSRTDELQEQLATAELTPAPLTAPDARVPLAAPPPAPDTEAAEASAIIGDSPRMPFPTRYWLLTLLFGAGAYLSGLWQADDWKLGILAPDGWHQEYRLAWHAVIGLVVAASILLLTLLTGLLRRRWTIGYAAALLMVLSLLAQLALGTFMLFDSTSGPMLRLRQPPPATQPAATQPAP